VAILNPDIAMSPGWDQHLYECLADRPDVAIAMPNRYFSCNGYYDREWMIRQASELGAKPVVRDLGHAEGFYAFMARRSVLEALGGFDERYRFYYQDTDFQLRALEVLKKQTAVVQHCPIAHFGSASTIEAKKRGELDPGAEKRHADQVRIRIDRKEFKPWHKLSAAERAAVRNDPLYCQMSGKAPDWPPPAPPKPQEVVAPMRLVIDDIYSDEGRRKLTEAYVRSQWAAKVFHNSRWLGQEILQIPEDIVAIASLIWTIRPKIVVECGIWTGGGLLLYASLCELMKVGVVVGVDPHAPQAWGVKDHPQGARIDFIRGSSVAPETVAQVKAKVAASGDPLFILDSVHAAAHVRGELEAYAPLVRMGGYIVVMDGIMNVLHDVPGGDPSWRTNNPETAVRGFLADHPEWKRDPSYNCLGATYAPGGFLRKGLP
jgi:cephalosporin hydroxylase